MFTAIKPATAKRATRETGKLVPFHVPAKGINARDVFAAMQQAYAIDLVNVIVEQYGLRTRKGFTEWAANLGVSNDPVHSLLVYYPPSAGSTALAASKMLPINKMFIHPGVKSFGFTGKVFAAKSTDLYDVTAGGAGPHSPVETGTPGPFWTSLMFTNAAGSFLVACNDEGGYFLYDGAAWAQVAAGAGAGEINGADPNTFCFVMEWKKRLWFIEKDTANAWYLPVGQITGTVTKFSFGEQFSRGGDLAALANWTVDGGAGIDDQLVAVGRQGNVAIYQGTDPDTAATFQAKGVWNVGPLPAGRRMITQKGGDLHILSQLGVTPVSKLLQAGELRAGINVSHQIDPLISRLMQDYSTQEGWQLVDVPREELVMVGVPYSATDLGGDFLAYRMPGDAWSILRNTRYASLRTIDHVVVAGTSDGRVVLAFNGTLDNVLIDTNQGEAIQCIVIPAYQALSKPGFGKRVLLMRPSFLATRTPLLSFTILTDYGPPYPDSIPTLPNIDMSEWDDAIWDEGIWSGIRDPISKWLGAKGKGMVATPQLTYACGGDTLLTAIDLWVGEGGAL